MCEYYEEERIAPLRSVIEGGACINCIILQGNLTKKRVYLAFTGQIEVLKGKNCNKNN